MSAGELSVEDVEGIRTGKITDPSVGRVAALAAAFGVPPSYLLDRGKEPSVLDEEVLEALVDERSAAILKESFSLTQREKQIRPRDSASVLRPTRCCRKVDSPTASCKSAMPRT